jgi:hypothetical protein
LALFDPTPSIAHSSLRLSTGFMNAAVTFCAWIGTGPK